MQFVFLSTMKWGDNESAFAPVRIAMELARRGESVTFIQNLSPAAPPDTRGLNIRVLGLADLGLPEVLAQLAWRGVGIGPLEELYPRLAAVLDPIEKLDPDAPRVVVLNAPFDPFVRLLPFFRERGYWLVYYPQDDYAAMFDLGYRQYNPPQEQALISSADLILSLSPAVAERLGSAQPVTVIADAVDADEFRKNAALPPPTEILRGAETTLGFWGTMTAPMFDADLIESAARARSDWAFNLIGPVDPYPQFPSVLEQLSSLPNVRLHPRVEHSQLIQYASGLDVCLIPAPDNGFSRGRDPLKMYEYLAAYKPVVAAHMPNLYGAPYIQVTRTTDEFLRAVAHARRETVSRTVVDNYLAQHNWSARAAAFLDCALALVTRPRQARAPLDLDALELMGEAQPVSALLPYEWAAVVRALREWHNQAAQVPELKEWAEHLETMAREQQQTIERLNHTLPVRVARRLGQV